VPGPRLIAGLFAAAVAASPTPPVRPIPEWVEVPAKGIVVTGTLAKHPPDAAPEFVLHFENHSQVAPQISLLHNAVWLKIDGAGYERPFAFWAGMTHPLSPGQTWDSKAGLCEFVPKGRPSEGESASCALCVRWSLPNGKHRARFCVRESCGPELTFEWTGANPVCP
jgi:hypothetical protein